MEFATALNVTSQEKCPFHESLDPIRENLRIKFKTLTIGSFKKGLKDIDTFINL